MFIFLVPIIEIHFSRFQTSIRVFRHVGRQNLPPICKESFLCVKLQESFFQILDPNFFSQRASLEELCPKCQLSRVPFQFFRFRNDLPNSNLGIIPQIAQLIMPLSLLQAYSVVVADLVGPNSHILVTTHEDTRQEEKESTTTIFKGLSGLNSR